jgi:organic radical activating enzyme
MIRPKLLDLHITQNCNLTCESCSDFNNHGLSSMLSLEEGKKWMSYWNNRIFPEKFIILGGEPTLHKDLILFLELSKKMWSNSKIYLTTNGFFLHQHEGLEKVLKENDISLSISIHHDSQEYMRRIRSNLLMAQKWKQNGIEVHITKSFDKWGKIYKGYGANILPYEDNNPKSSWDSCINKYCFQLHEGNIYKCPPLAYLPLLAQSYKISDKWDPYLKYEPLRFGCTDEELIEFFNRKHESVCSMCPAKLEIYPKDKLKNPLMSVKETIEYYKSK